MVGGARLLYLRDSLAMYLHITAFILNMLKLKCTRLPLDTSEYEITIGERGNKRYLAQKVLSEEDLSRADSVREYECWLCD